MQKDPNKCALGYLCKIWSLFLKNPLAFSENNRYNTTCCDMIAVKREVAAERRVFPWSECQEAGTLPGQET